MPSDRLRSINQGENYCENSDVERESKRAKRDRHGQSSDDQQPDEDQRDFPSVKYPNPNQQINDHDVRKEFVIHIQETLVVEPGFEEKGNPNSVRFSKDRLADADPRHPTGERCGDSSQFGLHASCNK